MPGMSEEILLRLGFDASAVKRGTMAMMDQQKKAASDYVGFWRKAIGDREQLEISADVRSASRANKARAIWRQRTQERTEGWKKELAAQRTALREDINGRGVSLGNLARNVGGGSGGHGGGMNSTAMRELTVMAREASRGNWSRIPGSLSILLSSMGAVGRVIGALTSPAAGLIGGAAAGVGAVYAIGRGARNTLNQSADAGFSAQGYQGLLRQAGRESGGAAGAMSAIGSLNQSIGDLRSGDMGQLRKFQKYGISTAGSTEDVYRNVLSKYESTSDPAKRAAMAMDIFGESYKKFVKTLNEGESGFNGAKANGMASGKLEVLAQISGSAGNTAASGWNSVKGSVGNAWNAVKEGYAAWAGMINPNLGRLDRETERGKLIDATEKEYARQGIIKPRHMSDREFERLHPDLAANLRSATMNSEDINNSLEDRGKLGVSDLAAQGRRLSGHIAPRLFTVTPRMRTAMKIEDLEASATIAWERGDDSGMKRMRGEADALRKANPWLSANDRDPTRRMVEQQVEANKTLHDLLEIVKQVKETSQ